VDTVDHCSRAIAVAHDSLDTAVGAEGLQGLEYSGAHQWRGELDDDASSSPSERPGGGIRMDLRRLRYFVAVAESLHFGRAAQHMHVVQSAISQQIKLLESDLEVVLLKRTRASVSLTEAGRMFLPECRRVLLQAEEAVRAARQAALGRVGSVRFSFIDNALWSLLPPMIRGFRDCYPGVSLELQPRDRIAQVEALENHVVDVALMPVPAPQGDFETQLFARGSLMVAIPAEHPLLGVSRIDIATLASHPVVTFPAGLNTRIREIFVAACAAAGFSPAVSQEASQLHTQLALVGAGFGLGLVPEWVAANNFQNIEFRPLQSPLNYDLAFVWRRGSRSGVLARFLEIARQYSKRTE
jgi:DNA-binding transcriptional LysR family regulator